jgi:hypothetical protein
LKKAVVTNWQYLSHNSWGNLYQMFHVSDISHGGEMTSVEGQPLRSSKNGMTNLIGRCQVYGSMSLRHLLRHLRMVTEGLVVSKTVLIEWGHIHGVICFVTLQWSREWLSCYRWRAWVQMKLTVLGQNGQCHLFGHLVVVKGIGYQCPACIDRQIWSLCPNWCWVFLRWLQFHH